MYSKEQASQLKQAFWTAYGQYMSPVLSAGGMRTNWVNYKTGVKHIHFKMQADKQSASIAIEFSHPDTELQQLFFEQLRSYKAMLNSALGEEWEWLLHTTDEYGKTVSRVQIELKPANIFQKEDWPALISFFKPRMIALDEFWNDVKVAFEV